MNNTKHDIRDASDIKTMVVSFYDRVKKDALLGPVFAQRIPGDWTEHLELMCRFWNTVLFNRSDYRGNPFIKHVGLPLQQQHFERWIELFCQTVDEKFCGSVAEDAKHSAMRIAHTLYSRLQVKHNLSPLPKI